MVKTVIWPSNVQQQLFKAYQYIVQDSFQHSEKFRDDILNSTRQLAKNPEMHPPDKYRKNNDGSYRAYELQHYRISYRITESQIIIVRLRHTSMQPKAY